MTPIHWPDGWEQREHPCHADCDHSERPDLACTFCQGSGTCEDCEGTCQHCIDRDASEPSMRERAERAESVARGQQKLIEAQRAEIERQRAALVELAPADEVLVEGSYFQRADLPRVLGNYMRATDEAQREAKTWCIRVEAAEAEVARLQAEIADPKGPGPVYQGVAKSIRALADRRGPAKSGSTPAHPDRTEWLDENAGAISAARSLAASIDRVSGHADRDASEVRTCTCSVKCNTAHVCAEMPPIVWISADEIKAAAARYLDTHPAEKAELDRLRAEAEVERLRAENADRESERADLRDRVEKAEAAVGRVEAACLKLDEAADEQRALSRLSSNREHLPMASALSRATRAILDALRGDQ